MSAAMDAFAQQTWYELLEVAPTASRAEILEAYARAMETYSPDSVAVYTLVDPGQIEVLRQRLTEARDGLVEVEQRLAYDARIGVKRSAGEQARMRAEALPAPVVPSAGAGEPVAPVQASAGEPEAQEPEPATVELQTAEIEPAGEEVAAVPEPEAKPVAEEPAPAPVSVKPRAEETPAPEAPPAPVSPPLAPASPPPPPGGASRPSVHARPSAPVGRRGLGSPVSSSRLGVRPLPTPGTRPALQPSASAPSGEPVPAQTPVAPVPNTVAPNTAAPAQVAAPPSTPAALAVHDPALAPVPAQARDPRARPKIFFEIPPDAEFNGELLRRVRESRGLTLQTLAERTRISSKHMDNIEADRYEALPATVYLRGMLMSVARELGLDPLRVCRSYMGLVASAEKKRR